MIHDYLPVTRQDMETRGWDQCDFVYVTGDAYVDHPSFGTLHYFQGFQARHAVWGSFPARTGKQSIQTFDAPGRAFSFWKYGLMVNHSVSKKRRKRGCLYSGRRHGKKRPDYAVVVLLQPDPLPSTRMFLLSPEALKKTCRLAHYDYWSNRLKRSILLDAQADLISYGMGEHSIIEIADALDSGLDVKDITFIDGTVYKTKQLENVYDYKLLPDYEGVCP